MTTPGSDHLPNMGKLGMTKVRSAAVAGTFYPDQPHHLQSAVRTYLSPDGNNANPTNLSTNKALIVPHAGYRYSGGTASYGYRRWIPLADQIRRVILLGPPHREPVHGIALPDQTHFATPLGLVELDQAAMTRIEQFDFVYRSNSAHQLEHSLEVQLPFLQTLLNNFTLVPLLIGECSFQLVAQVLDLLWGDDETVIICSSDLSHFHPDQQARDLDQNTADLISAKQPTLTSQQACGCRSINGLLEAARQRDLTVEKLHYSNSGDNSGDLNRVVGYGAFAVG
ncbi:MAG: AmmeMemoRadiSam system protein B [Immundisolibacteraceae bacterium]|nr:AmmeMemoRadiSam system protein B [Immundisolibacteraceae bacterium]